ncbi:MAG TPA: hypothetical protein VGB97_02520 [Candidatus Paceibacterota bacterium]|jgi:hypothetical protein
MHNPDYDPYRDFIEKLQKDMQPYIEAQARLLEAYAPTFEAMNHLLVRLGPVLQKQIMHVEWVVRAQQRKEEEKVAMLESGWWYTPSLLTIDFRITDNAVDQYGQGDKEAIGRMVETEYQRDGCALLEQAVLAWGKNALFAPWLPHAKAALAAHRRKEYELSVPVFLIISEGVATAFCKANGVYDDQDISSAGKKIKKALDIGYDSGHDLAFSAEFLKSAMNTTIYKNTDALKERLNHDILNRHAVLHGVKPGYGTPRSSLQAFMLADFLSELAQPPEKDRK